MRLSSLVLSPVKKLSDELHKLDHKVVHGMHHTLHCTYLGAVAYEAHGMYSYAAGGLLAVVLISLLAGAGDGV
jgi:hypothetical protein